MGLRTCGSFKSANHNKDLWPSNHKIRKVSPLRKVRKSNKLLSRQIWDLKNLFMYRPPLQKIKNYQHVIVTIPILGN